MSAERRSLEVMSCVSCGRMKAWDDGFPVRSDATCWECYWKAHQRDAHPIKNRRRWRR